MLFRFSRMVAVLAALSVIGCGPMMMGSQPQQPEMNVTGTLMRTQTAEGTPGSYHLSGMMGMSYVLDVSKVPSPEQYLGKQVAVSGKMDTAQSGGTMKIIVSRMEVLEGAPPSTGSSTGQG